MFDSPFRRKQPSGGKPGAVVRMRLNPFEATVLLKFQEKYNGVPEGSSYSLAIKQAIRLLAWMLVEQKIIEYTEEDEFNFANLMRKYLQGPYGPKYMQDEQDQLGCAVPQLNGDWGGMGQGRAAWEPRPGDDRLKHAPRMDRSLIPVPAPAKDVDVGPPPTRARVTQDLEAFMYRIEHPEIDEWENCGVDDLIQLMLDNRRKWPSRLEEIIKSVDERIGYAIALSLEKDGTDGKDYQAHLRELKKLVCPPSTCVQILDKLASPPDNPSSQDGNLPSMGE